MKKFRIKSIEYNNDTIKYQLQKRFLFFFWRNVTKSVVSNSLDNKYVAIYGGDKIIEVDDLFEMYDIVSWLELDDNCQIGFNDEEDIIFMFWSKALSKPYMPIYFGKTKKKDAERLRKEYIRDNIELKKVRKISYLYKIENL